MDYVTNKIVEEMKKHGEDGQPLVPGQKRSSPPLQPGEVEATAGKKAKTDEVDDRTGNAGQGPVSISGSGAQPESPGSPGDMVIDESSETTPKAASPAAVTVTTVSETAGSGGQTATSGATGNTNANTSKYEPLSDDE